MFPGSDLSGWGEEECAQHENTQFGRGGGGGGSRKGEDGLSDIYRKKRGRRLLHGGFCGKQGALVVEKRVHVKGWILEGIKEERRRKGERRNCGCQTSDTSRPGSTIRHTHLHFLDQTRLHPIQKTTGKQNTHPPIETNLFTQLFCFSSYEKY